MSCEELDLGGGATVIVCRKRQKPRRCSVCRAPYAELLCDFPDARKASGTCDAALCRRCPRTVGRDRHHCPSHPAVQAELPGVGR